MDSADGILVRLDYRPKVGWWLAGRQAGPHKQVANQNPARAARAIINCPISLGIQFPSSVAGRCWLFLFLLFLDFLMNMHVVRDTHTNIAFTMY
jgi:hypothetical protein